MYFFLNECLFLLIEKVAINMLHSKMNNYASKLNHSNPENNILKSSSTRLFFENLITQQNNQVNVNQVNQIRPIEDEMERYLALPSISSDSLLWWSINFQFYLKWRKNISLFKEQAFHVNKLFQWRLIQFQKSVIVFILAQLVLFYV
jgi:hypothetical protein